MPYKDISSFPPEYLTQEYRDSVIARLVAGRRIMSNGCWEWTGSRRGQMKYGQITAFGSQTTTHRASWMAYKGPIPSGVWVLHHCDTPPCFNPDCLFSGNARENVSDMFMKGRNPDRRGVNNGMAKLSESQVLEIAELLSQGMPKKKIARSYPISSRVVRGIAKGDLWNSVTGINSSTHPQTSD